MQFTSLLFLLIFFPFTILFYFLAKKPRKNLVLLVSSFVFYFWAEPIYFFVLLFVIIFNYLMSFMIYKNNKSEKAKLFYFWLSITINLGIFISLKYFLDAFSSFGAIEAIATNILNVLPPLGISVFMLQAIAYITDLRYNRIKLQRNFVNFALYISFFPQMICGPIVRYRDVMHELEEREENSNKFAKGYSMFLRGLAKKVLIAEHMIEAYRFVYSSDLNSTSLTAAWLGIIAFGFGLTFHFIAYSDMARGIAKIFGFEIPLNFNYPYISKSIVEFWRRFNISLTSFCKTYIFNSLWKNNSSLIVNLIKLLGIWIFISLWYGLKDSYILWGVYMGLIVILEKMFLSSLLEKLPALFQRIYALFLITIGWAIFSAGETENLLPIFNALLMQGQKGIFDNNALYLLQNYYIWFIVAILCSTNIVNNIEKKYEIEKPNLWLVIKNIYEIFLFIIVIIYCIANSENMSNFFVFF